MPKVLWLNPIGTDIFDRPIRDVLCSVKNEDTRVDVVSFGTGPKHLEYRYYEALAIPEIVRAVRWAEGAGYDAAIIGCFYDPGLRDARSITDNIAVLAPCETCAHIAATMGYKFSIIVTEELCVPQMMDNLRSYGLGDKVASFKTLGMGVHELRRDEGFTARRIRERAKEAVEEDHAEAVILGCTIQFGFYKSIQTDLGVPVIDPVVATFKYAELSAELKNRFGWTHSKKYGYKSPPISEIEDWGLAHAQGAPMPRGWSLQ